MEFVYEILAYQVGDKPLKVYVLAFLFFLALFVCFSIFKLSVLRKLKELAHNTKNNFDDELVLAVEKISPLFYFVIALYFPLQTLIEDPDIMKWIKGAVFVVVAYYVIGFILALFDYTLARVAVQRDGKNGQQAKTAFYGLKLILRIVIWVIAGMLVLSNLGLNMTSLVASLGIGSIAVALAVQNILKDLFSSFSIYFDRPFEIGDTIVIGDKQGNVKHIGLKTTRIQTLQGEELIISNSELTASQVQNFHRMKQRRVVMNLGVVYGTSLPKLKKLNELLKGIIEKTDQVELGRVHFKEFGEYSLNFEVVYTVLTGEYIDYMDRQQEINFAILRAFEKEGIEMAFPTQTVHVAK